jgi:hypothetical protein
MPLPSSLRRIGLPGVLAAAIVLGCVAYAPGGPYGGWGVPRGSYRTSCEGVRVDGYRLKASCLTEHGRWRRSSLDLRACEGSDIENRDGYLRCAYAGSHYGGLPPGSYIRSCTDVRIRRGRLEAECRSFDHGWRQSSIGLDRCRRFRNDDGRLACE